MSETQHHHHQTGPEHGELPPDRIPYWKRAHRDWRFWVGVVCIFAAIFVYVMSVDLSMVPRGQPAGNAPGASSN